MSNAYLSPILQSNQFGDDDTFLAGGLIWFYLAGTSTPVIAYTDPTAATAWSNPIQLNSRGETGGEIWLLAGQPYKMVLEEPPQYGQTHGVVVSTFDNIMGVNDPGSVVFNNWIALGAAPTYITQTSFSVSGDYRSTFLVSRRIQSTNTSGTVYSTVVSASYASGVTTVNVANDFGFYLDAGLSAISYGFIQTGAVSSIPVPVLAGSAYGGSRYQLWMDYDGSHIYWSNNGNPGSYDWPIIANEAVAAHGTTFSTAQATSGEAELHASYVGVNDAYLFNNSNTWGIYSADGGLGVQYNRATNKFTYGGFVLPDPSTANTYFGLPNNMIVQYGNAGTASSAGTANNFPEAFPNACQIVIPVQIGTTHVSVSYSGTTTTGFVAYAASTVSIAYIAIGY